MRALVLSGGGARGAFQVGVIQALVSKGIGWDVIAGVSVGAINGAFLAQYPKTSIPTNDLANFWLNITGNKSIYKEWPLWKLQSLWTGSLYNTAPLRELLKKRLDTEALKKSNVKLSVGAVALETGEYKSIGIDSVLKQSSPSTVIDWIMASAAFPVAFPPIKIDGLNWVDGGVRDITPITDVVNMVSVSEIDHIDVITTAPLGVPADNSFPKRSTISVTDVALRTAFLMSDEVFNSDFDRVPADARNKITIYSPDAALKLPDALNFDPNSIKELINAGIQSGLSK